MQPLRNSYLKTVFSVLLGMFMQHSLFSQDIDPLSDMKFIESETKLQSHKHIRPYIFKNEQNAFIKYNPVSLTMGGLMYFYQNSVSQQFSANCLYRPTCSDFSKQAIAHLGIFKGIFLSADRLTRCNRIAGIDIHPLTIDEKTNRSKDPIKFYE